MVSKKLTTGQEVLQIDQGDVAGGKVNGEEIDELSSWAAAKSCRRHGQATRARLKNPLIHKFT